MKLQDIASTGTETLSSAIDRHLENWAKNKPQAPALLHKRRGQWKAWRWQDVWEDVSYLREVLREEGLGTGSHLVLKGAYEPTLILLALAALSAGAKVSLLARRLSSVEFRKTLENIGPTHLFIQTRDGIARLIESFRNNPEPLPLWLCTTFHVKRQLDVTVAISLQDIYKQARTGGSILQWRQIRSTRPTWVEDGTEWEEGLGLLLSRLLWHGEVFAFPENSGSAARDRQDIAPGRLLLSATRIQALNEELGNRLPQHGSWLRRSWEWSRLNRHGGLQRLLESRVNRLMGLHRLNVTNSTPESGHISVPAWFFNFAREPVR
ncbi:MAG: AMP-binding protein [Azoarcus sp.]|nr:AMP-binding protein [Azoarcus sp.]